jgi:hypothetical protein
MKQQKMMPFWYNTNVGQEYAMVASAKMLWAYEV